MSKRQLTRKRLDRALVTLFKVDGLAIPRAAFPLNLYDYAWRLWASTKDGRRELARRRR